MQGRLIFKWRHNTAISNENDVGASSKEHGNLYSYFLLYADGKRPEINSVLLCKRTMLRWKKC
jgi:hypothetical protein